MNSDHSDHLEMPNYRPQENGTPYDWEFVGQTMDMKNNNRVENGWFPAQDSKTKNSFSDDGRRTASDVNNVENFMERVRQEKEERKLAERYEKQKDLHQLMNYHPWGKPGGGAPRLENHRMQKFTENDLQLDRKCNGDLYGLKLYRPGAGAPNVTRSGRLRTEVRGDPTLRYQDDRREHTHRYCMPKEKAEELHSDLRRAQFERAKKEKEEREWDLKAGREYWDYHPYGKPGAGAPNPPRQFRPPPSAPVENTSLPLRKTGDLPLRDVDGNVPRHPGHSIRNGCMMHPFDQLDSQREQLTGSTAILPIGRGRGNGAPLCSANGSPITKLKHSLDIMDGRPNIQDLGQEVSSPGRANPGFLGFGSQGGGSPVFDSTGRVRAGVQYHFSEEDSSRKNPHRKAQLKKEADDNLLMKDRRMHKEYYNPQGAHNNHSLVDQMMQSNTGKARIDPLTSTLVDQRRIRTDVAETIRPSPRTTKETQAFLYCQMQENLLSDKLEKLREKHYSNRHHNESHKVFGRPGGGAPNHEYDHRKPNLPNILMNMPKRSPMDLDTRLPIADTYSSHTNRYEFPEKINDDNKMFYKLGAPYATAYDG